MVPSHTRPGAVRCSTCVAVEREGEQHHHQRGERQHLVDDDPAAPFDAQVLGCDESSGAPHRSRAATCPARWARGARGIGHLTADHVDDAWPACTARSSSWLATITVAPADGRVQGAVELVAAGGVEAGVGLVEQPQLGSSGHQAGQGSTALLPGAEPADRSRRPIAAARPIRSQRAGDLVGGGADRRTPEPGHVLAPP
jgi:hypothetical protein